MNGTRDLYLVSTLKVDEIFISCW